MAHRIRGMFANARVLSYGVVRMAGAMLGTWPVRLLLESPSWGTVASPPEVGTLEVDSEEIALTASPFDAAPTSDGRCVFVSLQQPEGSQRSPGAIAVLHRDGDRLRLGREVPLTAAAWGLALVRDESLLVVANSHGVVLLDAHAARGTDRDPVVSTVHYGRDLQTIRVLGSAKGRWVLASDEHNRTVSILDLDRAADGGSGADVLLSQVRVDQAPLGLGLSADGRYLYVTCEMSSVPAPDLVNWFVWGATLDGKLRRAGLLCTIDLQRAVDDPKRAVVARTVAGGHPVRVKLSEDSQVAWVTARASNQLMAYSTARPESPELVATTPVGPAPVGLVVLDDLGVVLVANSNRFVSKGQRETLSVIDVDLALAGRPAILGHIPVGSFPREIIVDASQGIVYVTNFNSASLSVISIESLSHAVESARIGAAG